MSEHESEAGGTSIDRWQLRVDRAVTISMRHLEMRLDLREPACSQDKHRD